MGLLNFLPREEQYFDLFIQMTLYISAAAKELQEMLADKTTISKSMHSASRAWNTPAMS